MADDLLNLQIQGLDRLQAAMKRAPDEVTRGLRATLRGATEMIRAGVATYPPATGANRRPGLNGYSWYERGYGTRTVTGRSYPTSQVLGRTWTTEVRSLHGSPVGIVGTRATYARFVQDEEKQASFHRARGWPTAQGVLRAKRDDIVGFFEQMIRQILGRLGQ